MMITILSNEPGCSSFSFLKTMASFEIFQAFPTSLLPRAVSRLNSLLLPFPSLPRPFFPFFPPLSISRHTSLSEGKEQANQRTENSTRLHDSTLLKNFSPLHKYYILWYFSVRLIYLLRLVGSPVG